MLIEPNTNIYLLHNVPLDNTYEHTINFGSTTAQYNYFQGLAKYKLPNQSYQRVQRGVARVNRVADDLYDCNYMMFQNTAFGNKWFYAFINSVEYLNNVTSEITFEIDVMQTWFFDYNREYSYVERCHTLADNIGDHIEPEPLTLGEYVYDTYSDLTPSLDSMCIIVAVVDTDEAASGNLYDGIYGGATLHAFNQTDVSGVNNLLGQYVQKPDAIVGMYLAPSYAVGGGSVIPTGGTTILNTGQGKALDFSAPAVTKGEALDGYTPKNNKLYTYPYTLFNITNANGSSLALRYEMFTDHTPRFRAHTCVTQPAQVICRPRDYKGGHVENASESITLNGYPMCSWNTDAYKAWIAQNSVPLMANAVAQPVRQAARGAITGGLLGAALGFAGGAIDQAYETWQQNYTASIQADLYKGASNNGNGNVSSGAQTFWGGRMTQPHQYLVMMDQFFERFGYACNRMIFPPINNRPHWTYVKTVDCNLTGSVPADDMKKLCSIYNKGVTFWNNGNEVGNYAQDNSPL